MPRRRSPDGAPAAAQRRGGTTLTPTSGSPPSGAEKGAEPHLLNPASAAQETLHTPASATVALSQEAVCVATTSRIRRPASGASFSPIRLRALRHRLVCVRDGRPACDQGMGKPMSEGTAMQSATHDY